jgi:tRNA (cmo5U34)-methyltransferase
MRFFSPAAACDDRALAGAGTDDVAEVGDVIEAENARWSFSGAASRQFDSHIARSIPFYRETHQLILNISDFFVQDNAVVYDIGCATGQLLAALAERHAGREVSFTGIDCEVDMVAQARKLTAHLPGVAVEHADARESPLSDADLIVSCYTMQFIAPRDRQAVFDRIYAGLNWGGGFLMFEKVRAPDARFQDMITSLYHDFKLEQGYSGGEIVAKTRSLKGVLEPFSREGNLGLLERAGFVDTMTVFKYLCFEGFLAIK